MTYLNTVASNAPVNIPYPILPFAILSFSSADMSTKFFFRVASASSMKAACLFKNAVPYTADKPPTGPATAVPATPAAPYPKY